MKKRLKPLLPTLKEKKRYLAVEIVSKDKIKQISDVSRTIWGGVLSFLGSKGAARMGLMVFSDTYNPKTQRILLRCAHHSLTDLKSALSLITTIAEQPALIRSCAASGILNKAKNYLG